MRMQVWYLALLSGLSIRCCRERWCRSQKWLRSHIAVAVAWASSFSTNLTPSLGTSICWKCGPKNQKKKKSRILFNRERERDQELYICKVRKVTSVLLVLLCIKYVNFLFLQSAFLNNSINTVSQMILCFGRVSCACRIFSSIPSLYPVASSSSSLPSCDNQKCL